MSGQDIRMTRRGDPPSAAEVAEWLGKKASGYWEEVTRRIERLYPDVFSPEWIFGGGKHGWSLRYKKSRSFCTLIPEKDRLCLLIVFGAEEREKAGAIRGSLSQRTRKAYDGAATYHDGKWMLLAIDTARALEDAMRLLAVKRKPRGKAGHK